MLEAFASAAAGLGRPVTTVIRAAGPTSQPRRPAADVAVCGHVAYNAPDLAPFVRALATHADRRVVVELTDRHPLSWMNDLWLRFHGLDATRSARPPTTPRRCACALGFDVRRDERVDTEDMAGSGFGRRRRCRSALVRRRLCLPPDRDDEIADALGLAARRARRSVAGGPRANSES